MAEEKKFHYFNGTITVNSEEKTIELAIKKPSAQEGIEGQRVYSKEWADALKRGAPLRAQVDNLLVDRGLWSEEKEKELKELAKSLQKDCDILTKGGIKLSEAKKIALGARTKRFAFNKLAMEKSILDNGTVEGQAEIARLNYLISVCTVYKHSNKPYYESVADFYNRSNEKVASEATTAYMSFAYNINSDYEKDYPENKFLIKHKIINDKLQLLNENGKAVDEEGKLVNEFGQWVDDNGNLINANGDLVKEDGSLKVESEPVFLDDNENPILTTVE
jgi:hypothetical protein